MNSFGRPAAVEAPIPPRTPPRTSPTVTPPRTPLVGTIPRTPPSTSSGLSVELQRLGQTICPFGKYKGRQYWSIWQEDPGYIQWVIDQSRLSGSSRDLMNLADYLKRMQAAPSTAPHGSHGYMAVDEAVSDEVEEPPAKEQWLLAVLVSGCNKTCHGERWWQRYCQAIDMKPEDSPLRDGQTTFKGINGAINTQGIRRLEVSFELADEEGFAVGTLDSMELKDSDAPLLLSIRDHLNMSKNAETAAKIMSERESWHPFLKWLRKIVKQRLKRGRKVLIENPWGSELWSQFNMRKLLEEEPLDEETMERFELVRGDQCQFGLVDRLNGYPHYKPTGFATATTSVKETLQRRCDWLHEHQVLEGGNRTKFAQEWPEPLCQAILDGFLESLEERTMHAAFFNESIEEQRREEDLDLGTLDVIQDERDLAPQQDLRGRLSAEELQRQQNLEENPLSAGEEMEMEQERRRKWLRISRATRLALRRLHNMTGHGSSSSMVQLLRTAGATPQVIEACRHFACESCRKIQDVQRPNTTKMPSRAVFNHEVSLDCLEVKDSSGNRHTILSAVDVGTVYHQCWWVASGGMAKSSVCAEALLNGWIVPFGPPEVIVCDRGMRNQGRLKDLLRVHGIRLRYTGVEAPFQLGRGERQGALFKEIMYVAMEEQQAIGVRDIKTLIAETCVVKNMKINHQGFSPYQWVIGKRPVDETSLTAEEADGRFLGVQEEVHEPEDEFAFRLQVRQAAKIAFTRVDSSRRVRAALLRKSVPLRGPYSPGDLVCFHRKNRWHGPARVIGKEGRSAVWLVHGGVPLVAAESSLRPATSSEIYAKQILELRPSRKRLVKHYDNSNIRKNMFLSQMTTGT